MKKKVSVNDFVWAANQGDYKTVTTYVEEGNDINAKNDSGTTALGYACLAGKLKMIKYLLDNGADVNESNDEYTNGMQYFPLYWAISGAGPNRLELVKYLVERGANINKKMTPTRPNTALSVAIEGGVSGKPKTTIIDFLLENGAEADDMALYEAFVQRNKKIMELLIKHGANINAKYFSEEQTILMHAAGYETLSIVTFLIENGADVTIKNKFNKTALIIAQERENKKVANYLQNLT